MLQTPFKLRRSKKSSTSRESLTNWLAVLCLLTLLSPFAALAQEPPPPADPPEEPVDEWDELIAVPGSVQVPVGGTPSRQPEAPEGFRFFLPQGTLVAVPLAPPRGTLQLDRSAVVTVVRQPEVVEVEMARAGWLTLVDDVPAIVLDADGHLVGHLADGPVEVVAGRYFLYLDAGGEVRLNVEVD